MLLQFATPLSLSFSGLAISSVQPKTNRFDRMVTNLKPIHGKVITTVNDKTVTVLVYQYRVYPKYLVRRRYKRRYQAHDPENKFQLGDIVTLKKCRPISKTKHYVAVDYETPHRKPIAQNEDEEDEDGVLGLPLESSQ